MDNNKTSTRQLLPLFPALAPYESGHLQVSDGHRLFHETCGNPQGEAIVFLHGGPGTGSNPDTRRLFDPAHFRIIQYDQRGCGKSTPHGSLNDNTTPHLVADLLALLDHLKVDKCHIAGGSWGSTLALAFADRHPDRLASLLIWGIFLCRRSEFRALYFKGGIVSEIYPEVFERFISLLPLEDQDDPIAGYGKLFASADDEKRNEALFMWTLLEQQASKLIVDQTRLDREMANADYVLSHSLIENHYFRANGFIDGDEMLRGIGARLRDIPVRIINGRYDLVCPMITAHELHKAVPHATLTIVPDAGHSFRERGITDAIVRAGAEIISSGS